MKAITVVAVVRVPGPVLARVAAVRVGRAQVAPNRKMKIMTEINNLFNNK